MRTALYLSLFLVFFVRCKNAENQVQVDVNAALENEIQQPSSTSEDQLQDIFEDYDRLLALSPDTLPILDWDYQEAWNELKFSTKDHKAAALGAYNHRLYLIFDQPLVKQNPKTLRLHANSPFGHLDQDGAYSPRLVVNDVPYSGIVVGIDKKTGQRILEACFYEGIRVGNFRVQTDLGKWLTKSFHDDMPVLINHSAVRKPVLYLYPEQAQRIQVEVAFKGTLTHSYPRYPDEGGWQVLAQPNGQLRDEATGKTYPYLFWEGESSYQYTLDKGFVVRGTESVDFLEEKLAYLGLNRRETTDFITYWMPELQRSPYNLIHFSTEEYTEQASLYIQPKPQTTIRVFMVYQPLQAPMSIPTQHLLPTQRKGYTVVEWGGKRAQRALNLVQ